MRYVLVDGDGEVKDSKVSQQPLLPATNLKGALLPTPSLDAKDQKAQTSPVAEVPQKSSNALVKNLLMGRMGKGGNLKKGKVKVTICETAPAAITSDASTGLYGWTRYLNDVRNMTDFSYYAAIFDQYRVLSMTIHFDPAYALTTGGTVQPGIAMAFDIDNIGSSTTTTAGIGNVLNYEGGVYPVHRGPSTVPIKKTLHFNLPKKADDYASSAIFSFPGSWTNAQSSGGNTGGYRAAGIAATANSRPIGWVYCSWVVEFSGKFA